MCSEQVINYVTRIPSSCLKCEKMYTYISGHHVKKKYNDDFRDNAGMCQECMCNYGSYMSSMMYSANICEIMFLINKIDELSRKLENAKTEAAIMKKQIRMTDMEADLERIKILLFDITKTNGN